MIKWVKNIHHGLIIALIYLAIISVGWYGSLKTVKYYSVTEKINYSTTESLKLDEKNIITFDFTKKYYSEQLITKQIRKTFIPFIVKIDIITRSDKKYYQQNK
jgi:hypothetical protein